MRRGDPITIRVIGTLGAGLGVYAMAAGAASARALHPALDIRMFLAIGAYLVVASAATIALRKIGALLLVVPLAALGVAAVVMSVIHGPAVAVAMNLLVTVPLMCGPAYVVWRSWGVLR